MKSKLPSHQELAKLAQNDPEALEQIRQQHIEELINNAPAEYQRRLRGLQFQVDAKRQTHNNPMGACIEISRMMMESLQGLQQALEGTSTIESEPAATVLSFNRQRSLA
ncbi:DUF3135 domain-containing protein [Agaribacterium sp. ZY112]|uniref:DUF3135 domain-containing protein n=1 Tax=Agaribacterium sp. ZY112 TaxID=3233574 RepID=UPI00352500E2